jgi:hypothetical protein
MENERLITLASVCSHYSVEVTFVRSLGEYGLIEIIRRDETEYIDQEALSDMESLIRLHYDLNINMEGIDAISHLLKKVKEMQEELLRLRNRLDLD